MILYSSLITILLGGYERKSIRVERNGNFFCGWRVCLRFFFYRIQRPPHEKASSESDRIVEEILDIDPCGMFLYFADEFISHR